MSSIVHPAYLRVYRREGVSWFAKEPKRVFYNPTDAPVKLTGVVEQFGLKDTDVIIELFRINGGLPGYYLANLRDKKYYYCGADWDAVKVKLRELGIGRIDPIEGG